MPAKVTKANGPMSAQDMTGPASPHPFSALELAGPLDPCWALIEEGFTLAREHEIESVFTVANGYGGTRGSVEEGTSLSAPATFLAGVFETADPSAGSVELVTLPDWTQLDILVEGLPLSLERGDILEHRRILDLRRGLYLRVWRHRDPTGRITRFRSMRLVSLSDRHLFLQFVLLTAENYTGPVTIECATQPPPGRTLWQANVEAEAILIEGATTRGASIAMAHRSMVRPEIGPALTRTTAVRDQGLVERWTWPAQIGETACFTRAVVVFSSRETAHPAVRVKRQVRRADEAALMSHAGRHMDSWHERWRAADVELSGDGTAQQALRFAVYHLTSAVNPNDERVSVGARALTGSVYQGHVFWDTEIYLLPFYTFTDPPAARALLMYRYHTLSAAQDRARSLGYQGALYAWESADTGEDVTPDSVVAPNGEVVRILTGIQEHHISADIAYAVWQYWRATADEPFLIGAGIDMLVETARFWASRGRLERDGRYHIRTVIGPDEYHETVDDNAFTNVMAKGNLERAAEAVEWIASSRPDACPTVVERLRLAPDEPASWRRIAGVMATGFDARTNLFEQFSGFFQLEDLDLAAYRARTVPIDIVLGRERTQRSKVVKQADVIMLSAVLWDEFPSTVHEANFRYYEPLTAHGSSLSPSFHALVSARLGDTDLAHRYFHEAAAIDLSTHNGNASGGVHIASLGGLWQTAVFGMGGVSFRDDGLILEPHLPAAWERLVFSIQWRGRTVTVTIDQEPAQVTVDLRSGDPMVIQLGHETVNEIDSSHPYVARF
jgi:kojibiose phosphorylase